MIKEYTEQDLLDMNKTQIQLLSDAELDHIRQLCITQMPGVWENCDCSDCNKPPNFNGSILGQHKAEWLLRQQIKREQKINEILND